MNIKAIDWLFAIVSVKYKLIQVNIVWKKW